MTAMESLKEKSQNKCISKYLLPLTECNATREQNNLPRSSPLMWPPFGSIREITHPTYILIFLGIKIPAILTIL